MCGVTLWICRQTTRYVQVLRVRTKQDDFERNYKVQHLGTGRGIKCHGREQSNAEQRRASTNERKGATTTGSKQSKMRRNGTWRRAKDGKRLRGGTQKSELHICENWPGPYSSRPSTAPKTPQKYRLVAAKWSSSSSSSSVQSGFCSSFICRYWWQAVLHQIFRQSCEVQTKNAPFSSGLGWIGPGGWEEGTGKGAAPAILRDGMNGLSSTAPDHTAFLSTKWIFQESVNQRMKLRLPAEVNLIDDDNPCRLLTWTTGYLQNYWSSSDIPPSSRLRRMKLINNNLVIRAIIERCSESHFMVFLIPCLGRGWPKEGSCKSLGSLSQEVEECGGVNGAIEEDSLSGLNLNWIWVLYCLPPPSVRDKQSSCLCFSL